LLARRCISYMSHRTKGNANGQPFRDIVQCDRHNQQDAALPGSLDSFRFADIQPSVQMREYFIDEYRKPPAAARPADTIRINAIRTRFIDDSFLWLLLLDLHRSEQA